MDYAIYTSVAESIIASIEQELNNLPESSVLKECLATLADIHKDITILLDGSSEGDREEPKLESDM